MKICFVSTPYPLETHFGGIGTVAYNATRLLARRGHEVSVVSVTWKGQETKEMQEGVFVWRIPEPPARNTVRLEFERNWKVWKAIQELQPDVIHLFEYTAEGFLLSLLNRNRYALVTRLTSYNTLTKIRLGQSLSLRARVVNFMARQMVLRSDALYSPSIRWARRIEQDAKLKPGSIRQIVTGVNLEEMQTLAQAEPEIKIKGPYIIYYGRIEESKGVTYLADALPEVWEKFPGLKVVMAGESSIFFYKGKTVRHYVEQQAGQFSHNLIFTGQLPRYKVLPLVARAKLAVLPSVWEPYAHTCIEPITLGVPVITTGDSGGNAEIVGGVDDPVIEPGSIPAGWLVPRKNAHALASAIIEALSDQESLAQVAENARRRARRFDGERMAAEFEALFEEVHQNRTKRRQKQAFAVR